MSREPVLVECECITPTTDHIDYYERGKIYTIDMVHAKEIDIWRRFRPLRDVSASEAQERIQDEIIPDHERRQREMDEINEEDDRKLDERSGQATRGKTISTSAPKRGKAGSRSK
jgi:hypothetical protein